jgi:hypothetical protein
LVLGHDSILVTIAGDVDAGADGQGDVLAWFLSVGNCPALIISLPSSTFISYVKSPRSGGPDARLPSA